MSQKKAVSAFSGVIRKGLDVMKRSDGHAVTAASSASGPEEVKMSPVSPGDPGPAYSERPSLLCRLMGFKVQKVFL